MYRFALSLLILTIFFFSNTFAQSAYVGGGVALTTFPNDGWPFFHVQVGQIQERLEYRASLLTDAGLNGVPTTYLGAEILGTFPLFTSSARLYLGGGLGIFLFPQETEFAAPFGVKFVFGGEYRTGVIGLFGEANALVGSGSFGTLARAGLNFYF